MGHVIASQETYKKQVPAFSMEAGTFVFIPKMEDYSSSAAWAAARRAMGTRKGEQET